MDCVWETRSNCNQIRRFFFCFDCFTIICVVLKWKRKKMLPIIQQKTELFAIAREPTSISLDKRLTFFSKNIFSFFEWCFSVEEKVTKSNEEPLHMSRTTKYISVNLTQQIKWWNIFHTYITIVKTTIRSKLYKTNNWSTKEKPSNLNISL